jgi:hypothetical protein
VLEFSVIHSIVIHIECTAPTDTTRTRDRFAPPGGGISMSVDHIRYTSCWRAAAVLPFFEIISAPPDGAREISVVSILPRRCFSDFFLVTSVPTLVGQANVVPSQPRCGPHQLARRTMPVSNVARPWPAMTYRMFRTIE